MDDTNQVAIVEHETPPAIPEANSILAVIERAAKTPDVDIDKMERLFALHERAIARQAEVAFNDAMRMAQGKVRLVVRKKFNKQTESRYADIAAVNDAIMPVATEHGFSISFGTSECPLPGHMRITAAVSHSDGHTRHYQADVPSDGVGIKGTPNKTATHAFGSTMTYGRRYLLLLIFNVSTADDDGNSSSGSVEITDERLQELLEEGRSRAVAGMAALESWWKSTLVKAERDAVGMGELAKMKELANAPKN